MIGWVAVGFIPTYLVLEAWTRNLAKKMSSRPFINVDFENKRKTEEMKVSGL